MAGHSEVMSMDEMSIPTKIYDDLAKFVEQKGKKLPHGHYSLILEYCPHNKQLSYRRG